MVRVQAAGAAPRTPGGCAGAGINVLAGPLDSRSMVAETGVAYRRAGGGADVEVGAGTQADRTQAPDADGAGAEADGARGPR